MISRYVNVFHKCAKILSLTIYTNTIYSTVLQANAALGFVGSETYLVGLLDHSYHGQFVP